MYDSVGEMKLYLQKQHMEDESRVYLKRQTESVNTTRTYNDKKNVMSYHIPILFRSKTL